MSFGLMTAMQLEDIPAILKRCAQLYAKTETADFQEAWIRTGKDISDYADGLAERIVQYKSECKKVRKRL